MESWQPVDHHIDVRYHKMAGIRQTLRYHSAEFEEMFKSIDPKPEQVREWMVEDVQAVYLELAGGREDRQGDQGGVVVLSPVFCVHWLPRLCDRH